MTSFYSSFYPKLVGRRSGHVAGEGGLHEAATDVVGTILRQSRLLRLIVMAAGVIAGLLAAGVTVVVAVAVLTTTTAVMISAAAVIAVVCYSGRCRSARGRLWW